MLVFAGDTDVAGGCFEPRMNTNGH
ncbi:MAG: hypothetical protein RLZZ536_3727, partial [Planctomycetota bacterium]